MRWCLKSRRGRLTSEFQEFRRQARQATSSKSGPPGAIRCLLKKPGRNAALPYAFSCRFHLWFVCYLSVGQALLVRSQIVPSRPVLYSWATPVLAVDDVHRISYGMAGGWHEGIMNILVRSTHA
jgi:hypothetical protein